MKLSSVWKLSAVLVLAAAPVLAQGFRGGFGGGFGGGLSGLLRMEEVQKELKLDPAQTDLLKQLQMELDAQRRQRFQAQGGQNFQGFQDLSPEERQKRMQEFRAQAEKDRAAEEKKFAEILDAKQMGRLKQLEIQQAGPRGLARTDVADQLKLTPDQRKSVQAALDGERQAMQSVFQGFQPGQQPSDEERQAMQKKMADTRAATDAKLNAVLTPTQKQQFETMKGAAFKFPERRRGFGGGGGN